MRICRCTILLALALFAGMAARAADTQSLPAAVRYAVVKARIADKNWAAAIAELRRMNETTDPDWHNLMGYSLRKSKTPDYAGAEEHYDAALRIDPMHRGALEYSGELYLMTGDLPKAEARLATLARACTQACEEHAELARAVAKFKANGNKYLPED